MSGMDNEKRAPERDPIERVSQIIFGVDVALAIAGSLSAASFGCEETRTIMSGVTGQSSATTTPTVPPQ